MGGGKSGGGVQYIPAPEPVTPTGPTYEELKEAQEDLKVQTEEARKSYASEMDARRQLAQASATLGLSLIHI